MADLTTQALGGQPINTQSMGWGTAAFYRFLECLPAGAYTCDTDGLITYYNQRAVWLWGRAPKLNDAEDRFCGSFKLYSADGKPIRHDQCWMALALQNNQDYTGEEIIVQRPNGEIMTVLAYASPVRDESGKTLGAVNVLVDITDQKRMAIERQQLLESERSARAEAERVGRMKDEFLASLSHELRTPLNAMLGWSQLLKRGMLGEKDMRQAVDAIERSARAQTQLIEDLLDMSRIISGKARLDIQRVEPVTFVERAIETVRPSAEARGIRLTKTLDPGAGPVSGDPGRLQQVVWNLLSNAIKFTPRGGQVQVALERVNSQIQITVADTGVGIGAEFLPHLFEQFRQADGSITRRHGGLGLGLSIVKNLVELHGGTVRAHSAGENQGATFIVCLPLAAVYRDAEPQRRHPRSSPLLESPIVVASLAGLKILVVDDEPDARQLVKRVLNLHDAQVFTAGSADEALPLISQYKPDVLVSDIGMPNVDGYEFLRRVRGLPDYADKMPAIALTAFARSEDRTKALMAGYLVHVAKPVEPSELVATIAAVAGRTGLQ